MGTEEAARDFGKKYVCCETVAQNLIENDFVINNRLPFDILFGQNPKRAAFQIIGLIAVYELSRDKNWVEMSGPFGILQKGPAILGAGVGKFQANTDRAVLGLSQDGATADVFSAIENLTEGIEGTIEEFG